MTVKLHMYKTFIYFLHDCQILATANTQFGQEMALVMQTTHVQRWQYPDRVDKHLFSSIENVHMHYKNPWVWV